MVRLAVTFALTGALAAAYGVEDLDRARDKQDRGTLERIVGEFRGIADKQPNDATAQYRYALAMSYLAEVSVEMRDKDKARNYAENGVRVAEKAVGLKPNTSEYHRILGTLCGQVISSAGLSGIMYGRCALASVNRAIELDPKSAPNYVSHGVGNYYLPAALGGGLDLAIKDFQKAIQLDPKSADAYLWLGIALRKSNRNAEARDALTKAVALNPNRIWAKQQLDKTPPK